MKSLLIVLGAMATTLAIFAVAIVVGTAIWAMLIDAYDWVVSKINN